MISLAQFKPSRLNAGRRVGAVLLLGALAMLASACAVQESNTYPVEIFSEMHYSQASRAQEPPRLQPPAQSVAFETAGGPEVVLDVPATRERAYDPAVAAKLYSVNCSMCHGVSGQGDGRAAAHLASNESFFATKNGAPYNRPPNLIESRDRLNESGMFGIINGGIQVMPAFGKLMSEEDIRDIINYIYDEQTGITTAR